MFDVSTETLGHSQIGIAMDTDARVYADTLGAVADTMEELLSGAELIVANGMEQSLAVPDAVEQR